MLANNILFIRTAECESNGCWQAVSAQRRVIKVPAYNNCLKLKTCAKSSTRFCEHKPHKQCKVLQKDNHNRTPASDPIFYEN